MGFSWQSNWLLHSIAPTFLGRDGWVYDRRQGARFYPSSSPESKVEIMAAPGAIY